jgi:hypothetical protein
LPAKGELASLSLPSGNPEVGGRRADTVQPFQTIRSIEVHEHFCSTSREAASPVTTRVPLSPVTVV